MSEQRRLYDREHSGMGALFDHALGAYLGLAIGDALGATVEFMRPREIAAQYGVHREMQGGGWLKLARGQVTDDTTMSLALGDALLRGRCGSQPAR
jgi:ADP-ribosyl-[dinitrogen reductase] hydrolase